MTLPYTLIPDPLKQIGLIVLQSDETLEHDMRRLLPPDVDFLVSRVASAPSVSPESLRAMEPLLAQAASLFPRGGRLSAVGYGCTSAASQIGPARIATNIKSGVETPEVTEPVSALIAACRHLGCTKIGLISPYIASVSEYLRTVLRNAGIETPCFASFEEPVEDRVVRIAPEALRQAAIDMGRDDECDAVFLSCTNLRTLDVIEPVEAEIGKPTLSSNQVMAWHLGQLSGHLITGTGVGCLFSANTGNASP